MTKNEIAMLMMITIVSNCLGNLGSDIVRSAYKSLTKNLQQAQQTRLHCLARQQKTAHPLI